MPKNHVIYDNFVLENKLEDMLETMLAVRNLMTIDDSLVAEAGMKKIIHKYDYEGQVERLAMGAGNTVSGKVTFVEEEYEVQVAQQNFPYFDEQAMKDPMVIEVGKKVMIRETNDVDISNAERAEIANKYSASAFIRIHANSSEDTSVRGVQMLCQTANNPYPDCAATYSDSRALSEIIMNSYCDETDFKKLSIIETDTMSGINWCAVPTTILEMGFLSNDSEDRYMATEIFKRSAAKGIADGIDEYIVRIDARASEESLAQTSANS